MALSKKDLEQIAELITQLAPKVRGTTTKTKPSTPQDVISAALLPHRKDSQDGTPKAGGLKGDIDVTYVKGDARRNVIYMASGFGVGKGVGGIRNIRPAMAAELAAGWTIEKVVLVPKAKKSE